MGGTEDTIERDRRATAMQALGWWLDAGVDVAVGEKPRDWLRAPRRPRPPQPLPTRHRRRAEPRRPGRVPRLAGDRARPAARPPRRAARPAPRPEAAPLMLLADFPSPQECAEGRPLGGDSWVLAQRMLAAIGIAPEAAYLATSPASTRPARGSTMANSSAAATIARDHIRHARPERLLLFGDAPARALTGHPLAAARGKVHRIEGVRTVATFHPRWLLQRPSDKALAWKDLVTVDERRRLMQDAILLLARWRPCAAPALAQSDPLAPLTVTPPATACPVPCPTLRALPAAGRRAPGPERLARRVRRHPRRGLGRRAAGIATLPDGPLKPVAKAEMFTAKTGPRTELGADPRPARRGARPAPGRAIAAPRDAARRDRAAADRRAAADDRPAARAPRRGTCAAGRAATGRRRAAPRARPLIKADDAAGAEALFDRSAAIPVARGARRSRAARRLHLLRPRPRCRCPPRRRPWRAGRDRRMGGAGGVGQRTGVMAAWATCTPRRPLSATPCGSAASANSPPARLLGRARGAGGRRPREVQPLLLSRRALAGKLLRPAGARDAGHGHDAAGAAPAATPAAPSTR